MEALSTDNNNLFLQIRTAHRLLAAYYQRLHPMIESVASQLNLTFCKWVPNESGDQSELKSNIFSKLHWELLPGNCAHFIFYKNLQDDEESKGLNEVGIGGYLIDFLVICDTGILSDETFNLSKNQPDALNLPTPLEQAESVLRVSLFTPYVSNGTQKPNTQKWHPDFYWDCYDPELTDNPVPVKCDDSKGYNYYMTGFEVPLNRLTNEDEIKGLTEKIEIFRNALLKSAK